MLLAPKSLPRATRMLGQFLAVSSMCILLAILILSPITSFASSPSTNQTKSVSSSLTVKTLDTSKSATSNKDSGEQQQATDLSSMYVQIPIAEPSDTGVPDGIQQTLTGEIDSTPGQSDQKATSWTGPWPKKFQIGYIKQSDLHQVLIESLKNEPFASLGSPSTIGKSSVASSSTPQTPVANQASKTGETSALKAGGWTNPSYKQRSQIPRAQPISMNKNIYNNHHLSGIHNLRDPKMVQQPLNMQRLHQMNYNQARGLGQQKLIPMTAGFQQQQQQQQLQLQQQLQFASFPSSMFKNQPMYTINNYPHQEQLDQFGASALMALNRPQKSAEYYSSWRPVTSDKSESVSKVGPQAGFTSINDGFDEGFSSPSKDNSGSSAAMNRHPMLNGYLDSGKLSPAMRMKQLEGKTLEPSKIAAGSTKTSQDSSTATKTSTGTKGGSIESMGRRRAINGTSTSTVSSSSESPTTVVSVEEANSTTLVPPTSTTMASSTLDNETQEPDSEVIDSETTEPSIGAVSTVSSDTSSTELSTASQGSSSSTESASGGSTDSSDSEVATVGSPSPSTAKSDETFNASSTQAAVQRAAGTTFPSNREETTPSSGGDAKSGETEDISTSKSKGDSMSDEALLAAAVRTGSEIGKTNQPSTGLAQVKSQRASGGNKKTARSSERLVEQQQQQQQSSGRKSAPNRLITKKPVASPAGSRSGKQVGELGGTKSASTNLASGKSNKKRNLSKKSTKVSRLTQAPQIVSMTAAQAQSTAQTLASLLLSRCMSSNNCAHLLDICTTKQAVVPLATFSGSSGAQVIAEVSTNETVAWSMPVGLMSSSLMGLAQTLQADKALKMFSQWKDTIDNILDHDTQTGYTLILPSNEAIDRVPVATLDSWLSNSDMMSQIIDNHIVDSAEPIELAFNAKTPSRYLRSKGLQVNQHRDKMVTINGKRLLYANQVAPSGGRIHVIDGLLDWPFSSPQAKLLDIMDTLKQCDKFDGFVTLAEGTGLTQILKQEGPITVFVPSNEALRKIPDEELEVIKNNSTALKEFLMYHVVNGSYFSQDLRDGQQIASILNMKPIQVGVRVDGCSRRLIEANTSPMRRPDIVAKNGVIHILDWYLTVKDNEWCDPIVRSPAPSSSPTLSAVSSERLQQLSSESGANYATRLTMPANHKPEPSIPASYDPASSYSQSVATIHKSASLMPAQAASPPLAGISLETNNIIVSATPLGDSLQATA